MEIDASRDALIVVDVQNDFCPQGSLGVAGGDEVVPVCNQYMEAFGTRRAPIFLTRDWHPAKTTHFKTYGGVWPPHCVQGTPGAAFHPALRIPPGTVLVSKGTGPNEDAYSAFQAADATGTLLPTILRKAGVRRLHIGGLATDYCVRATALDALRAGFEVVVLADAIRAVDLSRGDGERAMKQMREAGASFITLADV